LNEVKMAKRRKVIPVILTHAQRERLERLWFYYGNYGPETTPGNHSFIQRLLENGIDERSLYTKRTPKSERPTLECETAVDAILSRPRTSTLRVIKSSEERKPVDVDPEVRAMLDDINCQRRIQKPFDVESDTPDAA
jgi:hypothetical protein